MPGKTIHYVIAVCVIAITVVTAVFLLSDNTPPLNRTQMLKILMEAERLAASGDDHLAQQRIQEVLAVDEHHASARLLLGKILWKNRDPQAWQHWTMINDSDTGYGSTARYLEGAAWLDEGDAIQALNKLQLALKLNPANLDAAESLLRLECLLRRPAEIRRMLSLISSLRPLSIREQAIDVIAERSVYSIGESLKIIEHQIQTRPDDQLSRLAKAEYLRDNGRFSDAMKQLDELAALEDRQDAQLLRLTLLLEIGDLQQAAQLIQQLPSDAIFSERALTAIARCCIGQRNVPLALRWLTATPEKLTDLHLNSTWQQTLGQVLDAMDRKSDAAVCYAAALLASEIEADAYRLIEGHSDTQLLARTMARIARNADTLGHRQVGDTWQMRAIQLGLPPEQASQVESAAIRLPEPKDGGQPEHLIAELIQFLQSTDAADPAHEPSPESAIIRLTDIAAQAGIDFRYNNGATGRKLIVESIGGGVAVLDYDRDGWPDLFFPQGGTLETTATENRPGNDSFHRTDQLYRNLGDGRFINVSRSAGIESSDYHLGCCVEDIDHDGDLDIAVAGLFQNLLYINQSDGTFIAEHVGTAGKQLASSVASADFDSDGNPDLWFAHYLEDWDQTCLDGQGQFRMCLPSIYPAARDQLLLNDGTGRFTAAALRHVDTQEPAELPPGPTLGVVAMDFDNDQRPDIYCANDFASNQLFLNASADGTLAFREEASSRGCAVSDQGRAEAGMGIAVGDFDRDQRPDLFVTNFYAESNRLYLQVDSGYFLDRSSIWRIPETSLPLLGFGAQATDFDLDGFEDLCIANGHIDDLSATGAPWKMPPQVLRNADGHSFIDVSATAGDYFQGAWLGRGVATGDLDVDGRPDAVIVHHDRPAALLKNETDARPGLTLRLVGTRSSRTAAGARVVLRSGDVTQSRWLLSGDGFLSDSDSPLLFGGLPDSAERHVEVHWPSGLVNEQTLRPDQTDVWLVETPGPVARLVVRP